jgi:hypothetical protein
VRAPWKRRGGSGEGAGCVCESSEGQRGNIRAQKAGGPQDPREAALPPSQRGTQVACRSGVVWAWRRAFVGGELCAPWRREGEHCVCEFGLCLRKRIVGPLRRQGGRAMPGDGPTGLAPLHIPQDVAGGEEVAGGGNAEGLAHLGGSASRDNAGVNSPRGSAASASRATSLLNLGAAAAGEDTATPVVSPQKGTQPRVSDSAAAAGGSGGHPSSGGVTSEEEEEETAATTSGSAHASGGKADKGQQAPTEKAAEKPAGARSLLNALPAGLLSLAGGSGGGDSVSAEEARELRLQVRTPPRG